MVVHTNNTVHKTEHVRASHIVLHCTSNIKARTEAEGTEGDVRLACSGVTWQPGWETLSIGGCMVQCPPPQSPAAAPGHPITVMMLS